MNADGTRDSSWYRETARGIEPHPALDGSTSADACVVGGGYTGLSAALHLAERGFGVVLLEAGRIGQGASGRNGGQLGTGQRRDEADLERWFGKATARQLFDLSIAGRELVRELVVRHAIDCDWRPGQIICAAKPSHLRELEARAARLARDYGYAHQRILGPAELRTVVDSPAYHGGACDDGAAHLHPLNFALGLARACMAAGVRIHEQSRADSHSGSKPIIVRTATGEVRARHLVLACNDRIGELEPRLSGYAMPINNFQLATAPLGDAAARLIAGPACVHDTFFVVNYFRLSPDGRLLFGGGETCGSSPPPDLKSFVRQHMLRIFPQLASVAIDHAWGGTVAVTTNRLPHAGRLEPDIHFAHGYSGHGVATATLAGRLIAEAMAGSAERFDVFARMAPARFPGGEWLRRRTFELGMSWYALRDRL